MSKKALIIYGTRFGATTSTSEELAKVLREEGLEVTVVNAKKDKVQDISGYSLIVVGSGMMMDRWTKEPEKFLKKFQKELAKRLHTTQQTVSRLEDIHNKSYSLKTLIKLAQVFHRKLKVEFV